MFLPSDITLRPGDSGDYVLEMQRRLAQRDHLGDANLSSLYDGPTEQAVREFQMINGLLSDGIAGPQTLRRLVSFGNLSDGDATGNESSDEQEEEKTLNEERADDLAMQEEYEQQKLANEAVWGYEAPDARDESPQNRQEQIEQEHELVEEQQAMQDRLDHQRLAEHELSQLEITRDGVKAATPMDELEHTKVVEKDPAELDAAPGQDKPKQLEITQEGVKARTPIDDLENTPIRETEQEPEHASEQTPNLAKEHQQAAIEEPQREAQPLEQAAVKHQEPAQAPAQEIPQQQSQQKQKAPRDPELMRTESQLDGGSQQASTKEGQRLEKEGVRNEGTVPESELGNLSPARSPAVERDRRVEIG